MRYQTDYSNLQEPEKSKAALADIENYLGKEDMEAKESIWRQINPNFQGFQNGCGLFIGIEGYPVKAWFNKLFPEKAVQ